MTDQERIDQALHRIESISNEARMVKQISIPSEEIHKLFNERELVANELKTILLGENK